MLWGWVGAVVAHRRRWTRRQVFWTDREPEETVKAARWPAEGSRGTMTRMSAEAPAEVEARVADFSQT